MKTNKLALFTTILAVLAIIGQNSLFGMKKQPKKDDFDAVMKEQAKHLRLMKIAEDKKKAENLKKSTKEALSEEEVLYVNNEINNLVKEYPLLKAFVFQVPSTKKSIFEQYKKDVLKAHYTFLTDIKALYTEQEILLKEAIKHAKLMEKFTVDREECRKAWNNYCPESFSDAPNFGMTINVTIDPRTDSLEEAIIKLRLKNGPITDDVFLNSNFHSEAAHRLAQAILKINISAEIKNTCTESAKKLEKNTGILSQNINKLAAPQEIGTKLFKPAEDMCTCLKTEKCSHTLVSALQKIHTEGVLDCQNIIQQINADLLKLETKLCQPEKTVIKKDKPQTPSSSITTKQKKRDPLPLLEKKHELDEPKNIESVEVPSDPVTDKNTIIEKHLPVENTHISINLTKPSLNVPYKHVLDRVKVWYRDPSRALENLEFKYDKNISQEQYDNIIKRHTFSDFVDYFIEPLAIKCSWEAEHARLGDISYNIPGQIVDNLTGKETVGVFSYGINQHGVLFHRCFSQRSYEKIENDMKKHIYDGTHPDLSDDKALQQEQLKLRRIRTIEEGNGLIKQNNFYVEIKDEKNNMTIRLFKVNK